MEGTRRRPSLPQGRRYRDCRRPGVRGGRVLEVQERLVSSPPGRGSSHPSAPATRGRRGGITKAGNRHFGRALAESAWLYVSASANSKELSKGQLPDPTARRHGFSALSLSMSSPWSSGAARAALMSRKPANCNLKSMWSDSPWAFSSAISPCRVSAASAFLAVSVTCRSSAAMRSSRSAMAFPSQHRPPAAALPAIAVVRGPLGLRLFLGLCAMVITNHVSLPFCDLST